MRGNRPLALCGVLVSCLVGSCLVLGLLVFFSPSSCCVSFPFNDDLGTPPTRRPHSWKKCCPQFPVPSWGQGTGAGNWSRELGQGIGRDLGGADWGQGTWDRELGTGNWTGDRELGAGNWALLCVVKSVFCCWRRWNRGPEVAEC